MHPIKNGNELLKFIKRAERRRCIWEWTLTLAIWAAVIGIGWFALTDYIAWKGF